MIYIDKIQKSLDYIEENLCENITLDDLASKALCSKFHYHRIFQGLVGYPVAQYIKQRKLSVAANNLLNTNSKITDIAMDFGFNSHAVFDRAFRNFYGLTPSEYRNRKAPIELYEKINLIGREFDDNNKCLVIGPKIIQIESLLLVGKCFYGTFSDNYQDRIVINFWNNFLQRVDEIKYKIDSTTAYGISFDSEYKNSFCYFAGFEVSSVEEIPKGMMIKKVPTSKYAVFSYKGNEEMKKFYGTLDFIFGNWLPKSGYELLHEVDMIEIFTESYKNGDEMEYDICIPLKL
jgi:AraC family transcriptional regulator